MKTPEIPNLNTSGKHRVDITRLNVNNNPENFKYLSPEFIDYKAVTISDLGYLKDMCNVIASINHGNLTYAYDGKPFFSTDSTVDIEDIFHEPEKTNDFEINLDNPVPNF